MAQGADYSKLYIGNTYFGFISLEMFELPERLPFGGEQRVIVNEFIGNSPKSYNRELQIMGPQPRPISWRGAFYYDSAIPRARYLDNIRRTGTPVKVIWGDFNFSAVIDRFHFDINSKFNIGYEISFAVIQQDPTDEGFKVPATHDTIEKGILGLVALIQDALVSLKRLYAIMTAIQKGGVDAIAGAVSNLAGLAGFAASTGGLVDSATVSTALSNLDIIKSQALALVDEWNNSTSIMPLSEAQAAADAAILAASMLSRFSAPVSSSTTAVVGDNLFRLAQIHYGNPELWGELASYNNLSDPLITAPVVIQLPTINGKAPVTTSGVSGSYESSRVSLPAPESSNAS